MRKEFMVERQGRSFCLYAGLLDLAHQQGLRSIRTELVQTPTEANNRVAICAATVVLEADGVERQFTGIGDAAPNNVAPAMQSCLLRMAETRAKARALRDAVNIGVAAFEELGEDEEPAATPERAYAVAPDRAGVGRSATTVRNGDASSPTARPTASIRRQAASGETVPATVTETRGETNASPGDVATDTQIEAIRNLSRRKSVDPEAEAKERFTVSSLAELSHAQASEMIRELNGRTSSRATAA